MADIYRGETNTASAGAVRENIGAEIIPLDGEAYKCTSVMYQTDLAGGGTDLLELRESVDAGVTYTTIWSVRANVANQVIWQESARPLIASPTNLHQVRGTQNLRYQWAVVPGLAANVRNFGAGGRTSAD